MLDCEYFFPCLITYNFFTILATGVFGGMLGFHVGRSMMSQVIGKHPVMWSFSFVKG